MCAAGATAAILAHYDKDGSGQIDQTEFVQLVSDLIDGTFESSLRPKLEQEVQMKQAAAQQQAVHQQQIMAQAGANADEVKRLRVENETLHEHVKALNQKIALFERRLEEKDEQAAIAVKTLEMKMAGQEHTRSQGPGTDPLKGKGKAPPKPEPPAVPAAPPAAPAALPTTSAGIAAQMMAEEEARRAARASAQAAAPKKKGLFGRK